MKKRLSKTGYEILEKNVLEYHNGIIKKPKRVKINEMTDEELKEYYKIKEEEKERKKRIIKEIKSEKLRERVEQVSEEYNNYLRENKERIIEEAKEEQKKDWFWLVVIMVIGPIAVFGGEFGLQLAIIMVIPTSIILIINHSEDNKRLEKIKEL